MKKDVVNIKFMLQSKFIKVMQETFWDFLTIIYFIYPLYIL